MLDTRQKIHAAIALLTEALASSPETVPNEKLLSCDELAARLGMKTPQTIRNWVAQGCPVVRAGRVLRFDLGAVTKWLNSRRRGSP